MNKRESFNESELLIGNVGTPKSSQEKKYLEDIKQTLEQLNQLKSNMGSPNREDKSFSLRSAQEIAILKQRVELLEKNN